MRSNRPSFRFPAGLPGLAAALLLAGLAPALFTACIGGTGTDTDNGLDVPKDKGGPLAGATGTVIQTVDSDGRPMPGVLITLHTPDFRPDSGATQDLVLDPTKALVSDSLGYVRFELLRPGKYVVEGQLGGVSLFFDTLAVADVKTLSTDAFRARPIGAVKGRVRLASGLKVESGRIFIRGTGRFALLDSAGAYDLGVLPVDVGTLAIGIAYQAGIREARVAEQRVDTGRGEPVSVVKAPVFTCREVATESLGSTPAGVDGTSSPAADTVKLDTAKVAAITRSCDSLETGTVVSVRTPPSAPSGVVGGNQDSSTTKLIAVYTSTPADLPVSNEKGTVPAPVLVPLSGCVSAPGTVQTTYKVNLVPTASGSDLVVSDVAEKCLVK